MVRVERLIDEREVLAAVPSLDLEQMRKHPRLVLSFGAAKYRQLVAFPSEPLSIDLLRRFVIPSTPAELKEARRLERARKKPEGNKFRDERLNSAELNL